MADFQNAGLLYIEHVNHFDKNNIKERKPVVDFNHSQIVQKYRGVEGIAWPNLDVEYCVEHLSYGLASIGQYEYISNCLNQNKKKEPDSIIDLTYCCCGWNIQASAQFDDYAFSFLGYDYGYVYDFGNNFSVIFSEVIYGHYEEMCFFHKYLNDSLLFPSIESVIKLHELRKSFLTQGAEHLENEDECLPIAIFSVAPQSI